MEHIAGFDASTMKFRSNTMELYFETEDFDGFIQLLNSYPQVERLHEPKTFSWLQRGIPDWHDRLIVLDYGLPTEKVFYCGASSKDAGKKLCAINETNIDSLLLAQDRTI